MPRSRSPARAAAFEPPGTLVIALPSADEVQTTARALIGAGVAAACLRSIGPDEMAAQVDARLGDTGTRRAVGTALNLLRAHRLLAASGCNFLIVQPLSAPPDDPVAAGPRPMRSKIGAALWPARGRLA